MKMKKLFLSVLILFSISATVFSQNYKWSKTQGSTGDEQTWNLAIDSNDNSIAYGYFNNTIKLGSISKNSKGGRDHFLVKYDCGGTVQWVQTIGSSGDEFSYQLGMCVDKAGSIYITSAFAGSCTFSSANNSNKTVSTNGGNDIYIAKYDKSGNVIWVKTYGSSGEDVGFDITLDDSNNIYATGKFSGQVSFGSKTLTSSGGTDVYVLKYDKNGNIKWVKQGSGSVDDDGIGVSVDSKHNVYVCGSAGYGNGTVSFNNIQSLSSNYNSGFIAKLNINGDCQWLETIYSSGGDAMDKMTIDNLDNVYLTGTHAGNVTATSEDGNNYNGGSIQGSRNFCVAKYDSNGNLLWFTSEGPSSGYATTYGTCMSKDNSRIYIAGVTCQALTLGSYSSNFAGQTDLFVAALDTGGNFVWADFGGSSNYDAGYGIQVDKHDNVYICGFYQDGFDIDNVTLNSAGGQDGLLLKYCNSSSSIDSTITTTGSTTLCGKDSVLFSVAYDPIYTYQWKLNGSSISGANSYYYYASKSGSYSVLIAKDGCCSQALSQSIQVQNLYFSNVLGVDTTICGASYNLSASSPIGSKFLWNTGDTSRSITLNNSGVYSIISAYNGCVVYDTIQIDLKNIIVNLGNDTVVCGKSIILDAQNAGSTYKWSDNSTSQTLKVTQTGKYSVDVTNGKCTVSDDIFVTVDIVSLNLGKDIKTCQTGANPLTLDAGTASLYNWSTGDNTRKITVSNSGDYWCKITDVLGCTAIDSISINYYPPASANFKDSMVSSHLIKFIPDSTKYSSYFWSFEGGTSSSMVTPTQYFAQSGPVSVSLKVITKDGCIDSITKTVYTTSIDNKFQAAYKINLFPNPSNGLFTIDLNLQKKSDVMIESYDLNGRKVYENKMNGVPTGEQLLQVNMQNVTPSIYLIKITIDGENVIHKLVNIN